MSFMKYCNLCKIKINKDADKCILCGNAVYEHVTEGGTASSIDSSEAVDEVFPSIPYVFTSNYLVKIPLFITVSALIISLIASLIFPSSMEYVSLVALGILGLWLGFGQIIQKKHRVHKKIMTQVINISLIVLFIDWYLGWSAWSITYVLPIMFITAILLMYISGKIMRLNVQSYMVYALFSGILGIIPALFIYFDWVSNIYLSLASVAISLIFLVAVAIFKGREIKEELSRRMHI